MEYEFRPGDLAVMSNKNGIAKEFRGLMCRIVSVNNGYGLAKVAFDVDPRSKLEGMYTAELGSLTPRCQSMQRSACRIFWMRCEAKSCFIVGGGIIEF